MCILLSRMKAEMYVIPGFNMIGLENVNKYTN